MIDVLGSIRPADTFDLVVLQLKVLYLNCIWLSATSQEKPMYEGIEDTIKTLSARDNIEIATPNQRLAGELMSSCAEGTYAE